MKLEEIIEDIKTMQPGDDTKYYPVGNFYVDRFVCNYRFWSKGGEMHYSAKAESLKPYIRKAIKNVQKIKIFEQ